MGHSGALYVSDGNNDLFTYSLTTEAYTSIGKLNGISAVNSFVVVPEPEPSTMLGFGAVALVGTVLLRRRLALLRDFGEV